MATLRRKRRKGGFEVGRGVHETSHPGLFLLTVRHAAGGEGSIVMVTVGNCLEHQLTAEVSY